MGDVVTTHERITYDRALPMVMQVMGSQSTLNNHQSRDIAHVFLKDLKALLMYSADGRVTLLRSERWQELILAFLGEEKEGKEGEEKEEYEKYICVFSMFLCVI